MSETRALVESEVVGQHEFIEAWLRGDAERSSQVYGGFADHHTPDFVLHGPGGDATARDELMAGLEGAHGAVPGLVIEIRGVQVVEERDDLIVAVYEEHQASERERNARRSTVVLLRDPAAPGGLRWRHLHETWIVPPGQG